MRARGVGFGIKRQSFRRWQKAGKLVIVTLATGQSRMSFGRYARLLTAIEPHVGMEGTPSRNGQEIPTQQEGDCRFGV